MMAMTARLNNLGLDPRYMDNSTSEGGNSLGIALQKPKFPQYAVVSKRLESFENWPKYHPVSADILSEAGLAYTGTGDGCRCYHCGGGLRNWEAGDNPWSEHAKWYPKCGHVKLVKGQRFIDAVLKGETPEHEGGSFEDHEASHEEDHLNSPAALSCLQMGYTHEYVTKAISVFIKTKGHTHFKGQDLCEIIFDLEDSEVGDQSLETDVDRANVADGGTHEPEKSDAVLKGETPEHEHDEGGSFETDEATPEEDLLNSPAALSCLQMGYTHEYVTKAISVFIKRKGHTHFKGQDLCEIIFDLEDSEVGDQSLETDVARANVADSGTHEPEKSVNELVAENGRLKEMMVCKICLDNKANVMFLPCGHMVSCPLCAPALFISICPMCRTPVDRYVKVFLAAAT